MIHTAHVPEGTWITLLGRYEQADGSALVQADVHRVTLRVFATSASDPAEEVYSETLPISAVVFDTLQTDAYWDTEGDGYNFRATIDADQLLAPGGSTYRYEVTIEQNIGGPIRQGWETHAKSFLGAIGT